MYLWVVIATFMVAILSYNLSVRPDIDRAYMETKAQTVIAKFKAQHNALMGYIASKRISLGSEIQTVPYFSGLGYTGEDTGGSGIITGKIIGTSDPNGTLTIQRSDIEKYLPFGFKNEAEIFSKVYCVKFNPDSYHIDADYTQTCEEVSDVTCCSDVNTLVYVVSWQPLKSRWLNSGDRPISDMMASISKSEGYGRSFGYIDTVNGKKVISGGMRTDANQLIYQPIFTVVQNDEDFKASCPSNTQCLIAINKVKNREENNND